MSMTDVVRFEYRSARVKLVEEGINEGPEKVSYMVHFSTAVSPSNGNVIYSIGQLNTPATYRSVGFLLQRCSLCTATYRRTQRPPAPQALRIRTVPALS